MSDYFGALMRASGLVNTPPLPRTPPSPADYGIEEIVEERRITAPVDARAQASIPVQPLLNNPAHLPQEAVPSAQAQAPAAIEQAEPMAMPLPMRKAIEPSTPALPQTWVAETTLQTTEKTAGAYSVPDGQPASAQPPLPPQRQTTDPGLTLIQAALRWVATGEAEAERMPGQPPAPASALPPSSAQARPEGIVYTGQPALEERPLGTPNPPPAQPTYLKPQESRAFIRAAAAERQKAPRLATEETIEVSIGTIHVRVDAPPPPAPSAPAPNPANTQPPRSGLSRRALWRI